MLVAGLTLVAAPLAGAAATFAPGRVVFPVDSVVASSTATGGGATRAVALPDGGAVLVGRATGPGERGFHAAQLTPTGSLDPRFGTHGVADIAVDSPPDVPLQVLRAADGKLIVVVSGRATTAFSFGQLLVVRLDADGGLDPTFGVDGIAAAPLSPACGSCTMAALTPDGGIVLTGEGGFLSAAVGGDPSAPTEWDVARLTPSGALDQSFGAGGLETVSSTDAGGYDVAVLGSGEIMTLGETNLSAGAGSIAMLSLLGPDGGADRGFDGGVAVALPAGSGASALLVQPDGSAIVGARAALFAFTPSGQPDPGFGGSGVADVGALPSPLQLLRVPGGGVLAVGRVPGAADTLSALRVSPAGTVDTTLGGPAGIHFRPGFGGGSSSPPAGAGPTRSPPLQQNGFAAHALIARPDGSYLAVGGVGLVAPTAGGKSRSIVDFAAAGLTPSFTALSGFGGPARPLRLRLSIPAQSAAAADAARAITVRLDTSARGLARVSITGAGSVIADGVLPIFAPGPRILAVALSARGASLLRGSGGLRITATATARDLVGRGARARAAGTLS